MMRVFLVWFWILALLIATFVCAGVAIKNHYHKVGYPVFHLILDGMSGKRFDA